MFVVGRLNDEASGVTRIVCDLANALSRKNVPIALYAADCPGMPTAPHLLASPSRYIAESGKWLGGLSHSPRLRERIDREIEDFELAHCHSLWMLPNHYASVSAHRQRRPIVFTTHGALEPLALARSRWKKQLVGNAWQYRDLRRANCIHVNSHAEIAGVRDLGLKCPIAIMPNGVDCSPFEQLPSGDALVSRIPALHEKKILLFLARLHPKKGLPNLLEAWKRVSSDHRDWHLLVAGPDDGSETDARSRVDSLGIEESITFCGTLSGSDKLAAFALADTFVLPSQSEGFSMAILEAMAAGLPVLLTPGCNFPEAVIAGAAIEMQPSASSIECGLRTILSMSDRERCDMGSRGRRLVEQRYMWDAIAEKMIELYRWLIGGGAAPGFVER